MPPTDTPLALSDLHDRALEDLLPRNSYGLPALLPWVLQVAQNGSDAQITQLKQLRDRIDALWDAAHQQALLDDPEALAPDWPAGESPGALTETLVTDLLQRRGKSHLVGGDPPGSVSDPQRLRRQWLMDAADGWAPPGQAPATLLPPPGAVQQARISLLLWDPYHRQGQVAQLTLHRVHSPNARLALAAAPSSAFIPCTVSFGQALEAATACWRRHAAADAQVHDTALAWDIVAPARLLWSLDGPSAGAAIALCGLWLLRDLLVDSPMRLALKRITQAGLAEAHLTAELLQHDVFGPVGFVPEKAQALESHQWRSQHKPLVYTAPEEADELQALSPVATVIGITDMTRQAQALAQRETPLTKDQETLLHCLLRHDPASEHPPEVDENTLMAVTDDDPQANPVKALAQYALKRWAWWALALRGQVHRRFVGLRVVPDASQLPPGMSVSEVPCKGLEDLLAQHHHVKLAAFMLRGSPGAGKSTLLQQHEQALCHQALRRWHDQGEWSELPLYLPLSAMDADADPVAWLHTSVQADYPDCRPLHDLLHPARRREGDPPLRLMFDGLNELKHTDDLTRNERAVQVLQALRKALKPPLSLLLSARTHHVFDLREVGYVAPVDVLPWDDGEMHRYIQQRFPEATHGKQAEQHWARLAEHPHVLDFCRNPFNLSGQCDLWAAGAQRPATHRADLYRRLLWQMLVRQLTAEQGSKGALLRSNRRLLSDADREVLLQPKVLERAALPPWPREGVLLDSLFRQGRAQWLRADDTHPGVPATARGEVEVPWDDPTHPERSVAHWLADDPEPALRDKWRQAVSELGLLDDFQPQRHRGEPDDTRRTQGFKWRHQSWGEYLASVDLLPPTPDKMPEAERNELLRRLQAGRGFARSALDELAHQRQQIADRWAVPDPARPDFWTKLLADGIPAPREELQRWLRESWGWQDADFKVIPGVPFNSASRWQQYVDVGALTDSPDADTCTANLAAWGRAVGVAAAIGKPSEPWHAHPEGWQRLVIDDLWGPFEARIWADLGEDRACPLKEQPGELSLRSRGDLDEVLGLALLGLDKPQPWLRWLLRHGLWGALGPCVDDLARTLEPAGAWPTGAGQRPDPVLQHLRRVLLLTSLDAGRVVHERVQASGMLGLLAADAAAPGADAELAQAWRESWAAAFGTAEGQDLRLRLEAALMLGRLGDNLRYERARVAGRWHPGLRLKPALWAGVGQPGRRSHFALGSGPHDPGAQERERTAFVHPLRYFELARLPVTVAEWQRFIDDGGYEPTAPWWSVAAVGEAAHRWIHDHGAGHRPRGWGASWAHNPLQPVVGITAYEAQAYVAWAAALYPATPERDGHLQLALPCEALWEAGMRGPWGDETFDPSQQPIWAYPAPAAGPGPLDFNHANTRWGRPSPVGVFTVSYTALGVADAHGNTWDWCCNRVTGAGYRRSEGRVELWADWDTGPSDDQRLVALRGGSYDDAAVHCRTACRLQRHPRSGDDDFGLRLVRCVLPHSEH